MQKILVIVGAFVCASQAFAHSYRQSVSVYQDSTELERRAIAAGLDGDWKSSGSLGEVTLSVEGTDDQQNDRALTDDDPEADAFGRSQQMTISSSQTWEKLFETRLSVGFGRDRNARTRSGGAGASYWLFGESLRLGADYSSTSVTSPESEFLDYDSEIVLSPRYVGTKGLSVSARHLATPTIIMDYTWNRTAITNRPDAVSGTVAMKKYVVGMEGAVAVSATRYENEGRITTETTYGDIKANEITLGWMQEFGDKTLAMVDYRYYREDEVTRAYEDRLVWGSDTIGVAVSHGFELNDLAYQIRGGVNRYLSNTDVNGRTFDMAFQADF